MTLCSKNDMRNLANIDPTLQRLKICSLLGSFWPKYIFFELKKYRGVTGHYIEDRWKLWRKNDLWFHKWHEEFGELHRSLKFALWETFLSEVYNVWDKKLQRSYVSWNWRGMQYLNNNWLVVWKMTQGIWLIFMWVAESLKICTLMGSFCQ